MMLIFSVVLVLEQLSPPPLLNIFPFFQLLANLLTMIQFNGQYFPIGQLVGCF